MLEEDEINGQKVLIHYLTRDMQPASKEDATLIKIHFEDGRTMFAFPADQPTTKDRAFLPGRR